MCTAVTSSIWIHMKISGCLDALRDIQTDLMVMNQLGLRVGTLRKLWTPAF